MTKITVLGSCRQYSIARCFNVTSVQEGISYPHYTKEVIEVIHFCKGTRIYTPDETKHIFRTAIINKQPIYQSSYLKEEFESSELYVIEIASKLAYEYNGKYVHHIASEPEWNVPIYDKVTIRKQSREEIEKDILYIKELLGNKPMIIVCHFVTYNRGERYELSKWLEEICNVHNIPFINPFEELKHIETDKLFKKEKVLAHYTPYGEDCIKEVYRRKINEVINEI